jgi:hypothetical protein
VAKPMKINIGKYCRNITSIVDLSS